MTWKSAFSDSIQAVRFLPSRTIAQKKLVELDELTAGIKTMKVLILRWLKNCHCNAFDEYGRRLLLQRRGDSGQSGGR